MISKNLLSVILAIIILLNGCSGYKEVIKSENSMRNAKEVYLYFNKNYYKLHEIIDFETYYSAKAIKIDKLTPQWKNLTIYSYDMTIVERTDNLLSIKINKTGIYKYSKTLKDADKTISIIGTIIIVAIIITAIVANEVNNMEVNPLNR
ncbi:hypothetical protein [Carboxylicivirga sp. N1Y90]|uniref:hypothetical protein n=1 Tax=Carboxylicivirga fragile TaxID=3417571 RepID=UPI003D3467BC|nr:hypothetical protein [Marinilabiliaceae bacterium N1Y90]